MNKKITKICTICGSLKSINDFYIAICNKDGHEKMCKECKKKKSKKHYIEVRPHKIAKMRAYNEVYEKTEHGKKKHRERADRMIAKYPDKHKARTALTNAVRLGKVVKQNCQICNINENLEAHHFDYSKPLQVVWLCRYHHKVIHGVIKPNTVIEVLNSKEEGK